MYYTHPYNLLSSFGSLFILFNPRGRLREGQIRKEGLLTQGKNFIQMLLPIPSAVLLFKILASADYVKFMLEIWGFYNYRLIFFRLNIVIRFFVYFFCWR